VTKLRASDGSIMGTFMVGGVYPQLLVFGRARLWVTMALDNTVAVVRQSDGALLGNIRVGSQPKGIGYDGERIWVANKDDNTLTILNAVTGGFVDTIPVRGDAPDHVISAGAYMWITNPGSSNVQQFLARDLKNKGTVALDQLRQLGLASDGTNIWVANFDSNSVSKISPGN
jgi:YVTN family beta-propeller protein